MKERMVAERLTPEAYGAVAELGARVSESGIDRSLYLLVKIRASQISGCAFCVDLHDRGADPRDHNEPGAIGGRFRCAERRRWCRKRGEIHGELGEPPGLEGAS